jgi:hypothetical protein
MEKEDLPGTYHVAFLYKEKFDDVCGVLMCASFRIVLSGAL